MAAVPAVACGWKGVPCEREVGGGRAVRGGIHACQSTAATVVIVMSSSSGLKPRQQPRPRAAVEGPEEHEERSDDEQPDDDSGRRTASVAVWRARPRPARHELQKRATWKQKSDSDGHRRLIGRAFLPIHLVLLSNDKRLAAWVR